MRAQNVKGILPLIAVLVAACALYWPTLNDPFHGDDYVAFSEFRMESFGEYARDVFLFEDSNFYWRPLGKIFHRGLYDAFGFEPGVFRVAGLAVYLATLAAVYAFCLREKLGIALATGAIAVLTLLPSHVVSVAWVTNTSRLMAVLFVMLSLLFLQGSGGLRKSVLLEIGAWLAFLLAALSDETALALAPVPVAYAAFLRGRAFSLRAALVRATAYGTLVLTLVPLQFMNTLDDEPRLDYYGPGGHIVTQFWALVSQLALPVTRPNPWEIMLADIPSLQWAAGLAAIFLGAVALLIGSTRQRFLVIWTALALVPFTLWDVTYTSPRYVNFAMVPYAILVAWAAKESFDLIATALQQGRRVRVLKPVLHGAIVASLAAASILSASAVLARNRDWSDETARWGFLARELPKELTDVPTDSRIVVIFGDWPQAWGSALVRTVYGDTSLDFTSVGPSQVYVPAASGDVVVYSLGDRFMRVSPGTAVR